MISPLDETTARSLKKAARQAALSTFFSVLVILGSLVYGAFELHTRSVRVQDLDRQSKDLEKKIAEQRGEVDRLTAKVNGLNRGSTCIFPMKARGIPRTSRRPNCGRQGLSFQELSMLARRPPTPRRCAIFSGTMSRARTFPPS